MAHQLTTCTFCGVGCGLYLETAEAPPSRGADDARPASTIVGAYPSLSHPTNQGRICLRGWHVHEVAGSPDRIVRPLVRRKHGSAQGAAGAGDFEEVSLEEAVQYTAERLADIVRRYGPQSTAFLDSPRCSNEEAYLLQKLARAVIGTNNVDHGTGVYVNNSIAVLHEMLGVPATTNPVRDLLLSDVIVVDGVDLGRQLPTVGGIVLRAKLNGARLIVIDARRHRLAEHADIFLEVRPGTETLLYGAMARVILDRGLENRAFVRSRCQGFEEFQRAVKAFDVLAAAEECGVAIEDIEEAAEAFARASAASLLYSTGLEARDADTIRAAVNLVLLTGQIGRPGAGLYALTEHNNLQGVCDMGMLPDRLPGYARVTDPAEASRFEALWGKRPPERAGMGTREVLEGLGDGSIRAMWLGRYDPASTAFFGDAPGALEQCDFIVVQHLFMTETARYADVILPTTAFGEETVSFTSTDRRIQLAEKAADGPGETEPAWKHIARVARALGADWDYASSEQVMEEIGRAVPFYAAASYSNLRRDYGVHWPCTWQRPLGTPRLFEAVDLTGAPFRMAPVPLPARKVATPDYPLTLVFGYSTYYWHQNVLIQHSETLRREHRILLLDYPEGFVEVNDEDARELSIRDGEKVRVCSAIGCVEIAARVTNEVRRGAVFAPFFVHSVQQAIRGHAPNGAPHVPVRIERIPA